MTPETELSERLYTALRHEKSCVCGRCSGGLNAVDDLVALVSSLRWRVEQAERERDEASDALQGLAADHYFARAEKAEAANAELAARVEQAEKALAEIATHPGWSSQKMLLAARAAVSAAPEEQE